MNENYQKWEQSVKEYMEARGITAYTMSRGNKCVQVSHSGVCEYVYVDDDGAIYDVIVD